MTRGIGSVGAVSRARMMAYVDVVSEIESAVHNQTERTISSARLLVCRLPGQRSERFLHARRG
jgi:uncharacterized protein YceH (UPF0502 family)